MLFLISVVTLILLTGGDAASIGIWKRDVESNTIESSDVKPRVFLTVSSLASKKEDDKILELNWGRIPPDSENQDAWIRLYDRDPLQGSAEHLVSVRPSSHGYYRTRIRFPEQNFESNNLVDDCLGFWIAYVQNNETLASKCLSSRPGIDVESNEIENSGNKPIIFLTASSLASKKEDDRLLELNWDGIPPDSENQDAWIRLYGSDPLEGSPEHLVSVKPTSDGYYRTLVRFPEQNFQNANLVDDCLGFWIAYVQHNETMASNCIRSRPNWMNETSSIIGNFSLLDMMIPGTHNTGTYDAYNRADDTIFSRYLITQDENVFNQLAYGIRYLDLRVAYQTSHYSQEKFWITHSSFVTVVSVRDVIRQVKDFLNKTNEIIIMDFHRFVNGFKGQDAASRHEELIALLEEEIGSYMIPFNYTSRVNLNTLWSTGKRLYVGYADESARIQSSLLFPAVRHLWGNVVSTQTLQSYLNQTVCWGHNRHLRSAMAQLTPTTAGAILDLYGGLRSMADQVNREVTKWFRDEWSHCANIVATDFFLGNNIIEVAVETNRNKQIQ